MKCKQNYIVSGWYNILIVNENGISHTLLNTNEEKDWNADFEFIEDKNIIIVPTLLSNKLIAYKVN